MISLYLSLSLSPPIQTKVDVIGVHVQELIHPQDCSEVAAIFQTQGHDIDQSKQHICIPHSTKRLSIQCNPSKRTSLEWGTERFHCYSGHPWNGEQRDSTVCSMPSQHIIAFIPCEKLCQCLYAQQGQDLVQLNNGYHF